MWQTIEKAPKDQVVLVRAPEHEPVRAIWYFGDWGTTEPILGDRLDFEPTEFVMAKTSPDIETT